MDALKQRVEEGGMEILRPDWTAENDRKRPSSSGSTRVRSRARWHQWDDSATRQERQERMDEPEVQGRKSSCLSQLPSLFPLLFSLSLSFSPSLFLSISQPTPPSTHPRSFSSFPPHYFLNSESRRYLHFSTSSGCNHGRTLRWHLLSGSVAARWGTASPFETYAFLATDAGRRTHVRRIFRV